jgi:hypothetical protein
MPRLWILSAVALLAALPAPAWADPPAKGEEECCCATPDAKALAAKIDEHLARGWKTADIKPAGPASDAEFLRRVYLDLAGRVPSVAEARRFLASKRPDRRQRLVNELLDGPRYATHFSHVWRALWLPEAAATIQGTILAPGFEGWLRKHLAANTPYNKVIHELLTTKLPSGPGREAIVDGLSGKPSPVAFYLAKEGKPENLAAGTSRLFLGVKIECAQCHPHPFADWNREQFWGLAAFFAGIDGKVQNEFTLLSPEKTDVRSIKIPNSDRVVPATFLNGAEPKWTEKANPRKVLADWVTAADNPYFARAAVNRVWSYFFGAGLVDPVDEMVGGEAKCSHPELMDEMARQFVASGFDLKFLLRAITNSRAYQLTSAGKSTAAEAALFARMPIRGLTAEQFYDSYNEPASSFPISFVPGAKRSLRSEFMTRFANTSEKSTDPSTTILHALALMNGKLIEQATDLQKSETLAAVLNAPFLDTEGRLEVLFLSTLSRRPRPEELSRLAGYVERARNGPGGAAGATQHYNRAVSDVFWVLLNSGEFILNH